MVAASRRARAGAAELGLLPESPGVRPHAGRDLPGEGHPAAAAAVRVLRRLRRLRRDALPQADDPAVRRPRGDRERHGLLVDLRRQPADDALDRRTREGRGPAWANSLFEDNAEFGLGMRLSLDKQTRVRARAAAASWRRRSATIWSRRSSTPTSPPKPGSRRSASGLNAARRRWPAVIGTDRAATPRPARARRLRWSRRASGSSAATAGRTTSATAGSITCWPRAGTSTSWCSTPRSTRTPAARCRRRRRAARSRNSRRAASRRPRRTSA